MTTLAEAPQLVSRQNEWTDVMLPIDRDPTGKNLLSMRQLSTEDVYDYLDQAYVAEEVIRDPSKRGISILPGVVLKAIMRQPSTRTGGSMTTAMNKLGGVGELISGMSSSSEAKGESLTDSWEAFATQCDILGTRTAEDYGPMLAARTIANSFSNGKLPERIPVINLGDGKNEHPTQALGDLFTIDKHFSRLEGLRLAVVGDHERYRAFHSLLIGAAAVGMQIEAVESNVASVPESLVRELGGQLTRTDDLDAAMRRADVLYIGRNPDEYTGKVKAEKRRSKQLAKDYTGWGIDLERIQQMSPKSIVLHPRPRRNELHPSVDADPRMKDVGQMANMIPMRMAIIARHMGKVIGER